MPSATGGSIVLRLHELLSEGCVSTRQLWMPVLRETLDLLPSGSPVITRPWRWAPLPCWLQSMTPCWYVQHSILYCKRGLVERTERKTQNNSARPLLICSGIPSLSASQNACNHLDCCVSSEPQHFMVPDRRAVL